MHARARSTARSRRLALAVACVVVAFFGNRAREANADAISDVRAQCANALAVDDPPCAHGTMRWRCRRHIRTIAPVARWRGIRAKDVPAVGAARRATCVNLEMSAARGP